ncbi:hypothetical protein [Methylobacter sp.]|uniref:hypothetical protein n=1 Tax=Methylobacter sp. TaxID=2051955 RepID=UPI003DA3C73C
MNNFQKDILIGLIFITGILGFISGKFIISTVLFASAAVASNVLHYEKQVAGYLSDQVLLICNSRIMTLSRHSV